jgi:threonine/homoserine/homoserine lactone efflux protein
MLTYTILGALLVSSAHVVPSVSIFLQKYMKIFLGPLLILVGLFLFDIFSVNTGGTLLNQETQQKLGRQGIWGALILGAILALSFCPVSAALFFGNTITLAVKHQSRILIPALYGIGTAAPVVVFSFIIAFGVQKIGTVFNKLAVFEKWARRISGGIFILAGIYYIVSNII